MFNQHFYHLGLIASGTQNYTLYEIITLVTGMLLWTFLYLYLAYRGLKFKFVQMPMVLACANIVWEFLWGFIFQSQYEVWMMIGVGLAFAIDLVIFYGIMRFKRPQLANPFYKAYLPWLAALGICVWTAIWWTFKAEGIDSDGGGVSGNILNAVIAVWWISELIQTDGLGLMSSRLGWLKLLADIPIALFMMSVFPTKYFAYGITWVAVLFDALYLVVFYMKKAGKWPAMTSDPGKV